MHPAVGDAELLRQYVESRSQEAFAELVRRYVDLVYTSARRQVGEPNLAEDVTQQVFVVLAAKAKSLRSETVLGSWLLAVARNESRNVMKVLARRQRHEREAGEMKSRESRRAPESPPGGHEEARWEALEPSLDEALSELSEGDRRAVVLRYFQNKSHRECAAALGITELSMRQRVHRGIERMRAFFAGRGMSVSAAGLTVGLAAKAVDAAPAGVVEGVLAAQAAALAAGATGAGSGMALEKGVVLAMAKSNSVTVAAVAVLVVAGAAAVWLATRPAPQPRQQAQATTRVTTPATAPQTPPAPPRAAVDPDFVIPATRGPEWRAGGHPMFLPIPGLAYADKRGTRNGNDHVAYIERSSWVKYEEVELAGGDNTVVMAISCDQRYAGEVISLHLDDPDGPVIGKLTVKATPGTFEQQATIIEAPRGKHDIYLTFTGGGFNIRSLKFTAGVRDATQMVNGSSHAGASQGIAENGTRVLGLGGGKWLRYDTLDFGAGVDWFEAEMMLRQAAGGKIEVRLDKEDGPVIAEQSLDGGEMGTFTIVQLHAPIKAVDGKAVKGIHDVYLTASGEKHVADLNWIRFGRGEVKAPGIVRTPNVVPVPERAPRGNLLSRIFARPATTKPAAAPAPTGATTRPVPQPAR